MNQGRKGRQQAGRAGWAGSRTVASGTEFRGSTMPNSLSHSWQPGLCPDCKKDGRRSTESLPPGLPSPVEGRSLPHYLYTTPRKDPDGPYLDHGPIYGPITECRDTVLNWPVPELWARARVHCIMTDSST